MDIQSLDKRIYSLVKRVRQEKSLSQEKLAELSSKDRTYISSLERHERNISLKTLIEILAALDIDLETFLEEIKNEKI